MTGILVASTRGVSEGSSLVACTTTIVEVDMWGITVIGGVRMVMVESMGGKVGIAPQDDSTTVKNTRIRSFVIDFISFSLYKIYNSQTLNEIQFIVLNPLLCKFLAKSKPGYPHLQPS